MLSYIATATCCPSPRDVAEAGRREYRKRHERRRKYIADAGSNLHGQPAPWDP